MIVQASEKGPFTKSWLRCRSTSSRQMLVLYLSHHLTATLNSHRITVGACNELGRTYQDLKWKIEAKYVDFYEEQSWMLKLS